MTGFIFDKVITIKHFKNDYRLNNWIQDKFNGLV